MTVYTSGYTSGNYEAFARSRKPDGVDDKTAWFVGSGLASLAGAVFLIRDAHMEGSKITILEEGSLAGGALDGIKEPEAGFVMRGGREMEDHNECVWDLFRSIPSLEVPGASVLDEFYWLNKDDPNSSLCRATEKRGVPLETNGKFTLSDKALHELQNLFLHTAEQFEEKRINEVFSSDFFASNFWLYWRTMFAFEEWHSALEMKLYLHRYIHHISGLADMSALKFTKYNQYESFVLPLRKYLEDKGVNFQFSTTVTDVDFAFSGNSKQATRIHWTIRNPDGTETSGGKDLGPNDLLFATIGSLVENSINGDHQTPARIDDGPSPAWDLWRRIAAKAPKDEFGHPNVFGAHIDQTKWEAATVTTVDKRIPAYMQKICKRNPFAGKTVTGGIVTAKDSSWLLSWTVNRQPQFKNQAPNEIVAWVYALFVDKPGDFVKKPMKECTGEEITQEWLYHLGVPDAEIAELAATGAKTVPSMMPYVTSFFMPRSKGDRPDVVPAGSVNLAFIGQFAEAGTRDCIFTTEYSVRTAMEAVYKLLGVERGIPEVFNSTYDIRTIIAAATSLRDNKPLQVPGPAVISHWILNKIERTVLGATMADEGLIPDHRDVAEVEEDHDLL